jgi:16S rRNA (adenine1518-N6/adenine1519-N6)-dimethyltransferase
MLPRAKRRLGQHFLSDPRILDRIADALALNGEDIVLEIGPGPGGLTRALAARAGTVIAIEKDRDLIGDLRAKYPMVEVLQADALDVDWPSVVAVAAVHGGAAKTWKLTGNIPYNITSPLIDKALTPPMPSVVVFLVQKEVAERVTAAPNAAEYGALTVGVQAVAVTERLFTVPAGAFHPAPKVDSAVLRLTPLERPLIPDADRESFRRMVVGLFGFRRKQLARGLRELTGWEAPRVLRLLAETAIDPRARPETLSPSAFVGLHRALVDGGWFAR